MQQKSFTLINKGMNRDLSISKTGESSAFENHNIRIEARDGDTTLSVTNERGNREIVFGEDEPAIEGLVIGWNVLNNHLILFTHDEEELVDRIYRVDYDDESFSNHLLFHGNLNFDSECPIESIVSFETEEVQKIYWIDGRNVLRFMNIMDEDRIGENWNDDNTAFDSNRPAEFSATAKIEKDNSGNSRPNGVVQYLLTYFNKHGQETNYTWMSDLVYLSPNGRGGASDETNNNQVTLTFSGLDTSFTHFRVYSVFRSSLDGETTSYLVYEGKTSSVPVVVVDDNSHNILQDATRLLYLGSQAVKAGTISYKDETLFLGDLQSVGKASYNDVEAAIKEYMYDEETGLSSAIRFELSAGNGATGDVGYVENSGTYPYENQLKYTSSQILSFKGNEKYRFGLKFQIADGTETDAFWIGDAVNPLYPVVDKNKSVIHRPIAVCTIPSEVIDKILQINPAVKTIQLVMAEATYADRSVKAQGIINPTVFNTWERYQDRLYAMPSWCARPRNTGIAYKHFEAIHKSTLSTGEIACSYWEDGGLENAYFRFKDYSSGGQTHYADEPDGLEPYDLLMIIYHLSFFKENGKWSTRIDADVLKGTCKPGTDISTLQNLEFSSWPYRGEYESPWREVNLASGAWYRAGYIYETPEVSLTLVQGAGWGMASGREEDSVRLAYLDMFNMLSNNSYSEVDQKHIVLEQTVQDWFSQMPRTTADVRYEVFVSREFPTFTRDNYDAPLVVVNAHPLPSRWIFPNESGSGVIEGDMISSKYRKHIMYVDENTVTLNSPELAYEAVSVDNAGYKFRIVGVAKMTSNITDYKLKAEQGYLAGSNVRSVSFTGTTEFRSNTDGLSTWPLWEDYGVTKKNDKFVRSSDIVGYWSYVWGKSGNITGYYKRKEDITQENELYDDHEYSILNKKRTANLHFSYETIYSPYSGFDYTPESLREFNFLSSQTLRITVNNKSRYYDGIIDTSLDMPADNKYPIVFSEIENDTTLKLDATEDIEDIHDAMLFVDNPVHIQYHSTPHAVITLPTWREEGYYKQRLLPYIFSADQCEFIERDATYTGALLPWIDYNSANQNVYPYVDFMPVQDLYDFENAGKSALAGDITMDDSYLFIGEIYKDFSTKDTRYGGITESAVQNNRFIAAGPAYPIENFYYGHSGIIYGNQGDTYFQRWDCMKTKPYSEDAEYGVTDIISFLVETHINVEGRTDLQRGINNLTDINMSTYGNINPVYSQKNNFKIARDLDEDFNTDSYRSTLTWTLKKADLADVDEWTHITLASSLKLDGDKGICRALRRYGNDLMAFQDKGVSEIMFNSRVQVTTSDGVPVEVANSGKVDGKYYLSNKYGCTNKWSIVEGKAGLYFVDNINKAMCAITTSKDERRGGIYIQDMSTRMGFSAWFRTNNRTQPWTPKNFENLVAFYDKIHSDVYLVLKESGDESCLVYNESIGAFTSFFDYSSISMLANVGDRFVSYRPFAGEQSGLWLQNEGLYCNFFGQQYPFWMKYRVAPEPLNDKIWTNVDFQADFFRILDEDGNTLIAPEYDLTNPDEQDYQEWETFDELEVWNEYQTTGKFIRRPEKKFRTWRHAIPRAKSNDMNIHSLDRIRNPWINLRMKKLAVDKENQDLMQLHDIVVKYFE